MCLGPCSGEGVLGAPGHAMQPQSNLKQLGHVASMGCSSILSAVVRAKFGPNTSCCGSQIEHTAPLCGPVTAVTKEQCWTVLWAVKSQEGSARPLKKAEPIMGHVWALCGKRAANAGIMLGHC